MEAIILFLILMTVGYAAGRMAEKKHYQSIETREQQFLSLPTVTLKNVSADGRSIKSAKLVSGNVVVSVDYFKRFLAGLRNFFGGRVTSYESLIDRARREAILRMKEMSKGADIIMNLRLETSSISKGRKKAVGSIEVLAYGTAVTYGAQGAQATAAPAARPQKSARPQTARTQAAARPPRDRPQVSATARYKVVFSGEIAPGQDLQQVKTKVAALYKVPVAQCERLFSGQPVKIKENLDYQTAQKYQHAFERTGAVCRIEEQQPL
jgi:uncharacterized protein YbjQ (UPF0145 family)